MIVTDDRGKRVLDFSDWTPTMMAVTCLLLKLPSSFGPDDPFPDRQEFGVDRLSKMPLGHRALELMLAAMRGGLPMFRPTENDVVRLGQKLLKRELKSMEKQVAKEATADLERVVADHSMLPRRRSAGQKQNRAD